MFLIEDIIDLAIQIEQNAEKVYRDAQKKISNPGRSSFLQWLADEEMTHAKWFSGLKKTVNIEQQDPNVVKMGRALLRDVLGSQSFSLRDADFSEIHQISQLLAVAIEFEGDKVTFYRLLLPFIDDAATREFLESIILEEKNHIRRLKKFLKNGTVEDAMLSQAR
jgi:rubrerythrin